jgi:arginase
MEKSMICNRYAFQGAGFGVSGRRPETASAPHVLRSYGLLKALEQHAPKIHDAGDLTREGIRDILVEDGINNATLSYEYLRDLCTKTYELARNGYLPITVGGEHSISLATIRGVQRALFELNSSSSLGVVWIDAHPDLNTPQSSPSGNLHGMGLRLLCGQGNQKLSSLDVPDVPHLIPENIVCIGLRDIDPGERDFILSNGVRVFSMKSIDTVGISTVIAEAIEYLTLRCNAISVSFDLDVFEPSLAPGVAVPVWGGLTLRECHYIMEELFQVSEVVSLDMVEYCPRFDRDGITALYLQELLLSFVGKTIL